MGTGLNAILVLVLGLLLAGLFQFHSQLFAFFKYLQGLKRKTPAPTNKASTGRIDTKGAIDDMRLAYSYLEDWAKDKGDLDVLSFAAKYIEQARTKDPNAEITVETNGREVSYTQDELSARTLYYESAHYILDKRDRKKLKKAANLLRRAIAYNPYNHAYRAQLADVYLDLHDNRNALAVAKEALDRAPTDIDARKLFNRIEAAPHTPRFDASWTGVGCILPLIGLGLFIGAIAALFKGSFDAAFGMFVMSLIVVGITRIAQSRETAKEAQQKAQDEEQKRRRG